MHFWQNPKFSCGLHDYHEQHTESVTIWGTQPSHFPHSDTSSVAPSPLTSARASTSLTQRPPPHHAGRRTSGGEKFRPKGSSKRKYVGYISIVLSQHYYRGGHVDLLSFANMYYYNATALLLLSVVLLLPYLVLVMACPCRSSGPCTQTSCHPTPSHPLL